MVLKALYEIFDNVGIKVVQLSLSGRAAKRMQEVTGRPAFTMAHFLSPHIVSAPSEHCIVVIDEASMVDIITMSQLCERLGDLPRLLLVGDPSQLMPVGPGLVLHALEKIPQVPVTRLTAVSRLGGVIASAAASIREGRWPEISSCTNQEISFIPTSRVQYENDACIANTVADLWQKDPLNTKILCTRRSGPDGTDCVNQSCQNAFNGTATLLKVWSVEHVDYVRTHLRLGDRVLCTRNLWDRGLQNGSLGTICEIEDQPHSFLRDDREFLCTVIAWADWDDGKRRPISEDILDDLQLSYAITIHKAQGSQWPRVIVVLAENRTLDRTVVYTAITRAQKQVILFGNNASMREAVERLPRAQLRRVALK